MYEFGYQKTEFEEKVYENFISDYLQPVEAMEVEWVPTVRVCVFPVLQNRIAPMTLEHEKRLFR